MGKCQKSKIKKDLCKIGLYTIHKYAEMYQMNKISGKLSPICQITNGTSDGIERAAPWTPRGGGGPNCIKRWPNRVGTAYKNDLTSWEGKHSSRVTASPQQVKMTVPH